MQFESYVLAAGTANDLIDVKFASGIKNINVGFYPYKPLPLATGLSRWSSWYDAALELQKVVGSNPI